MAVYNLSRRYPSELGTLSFLPYNEVSDTILTTSAVLKCVFMPQWTFCPRTEVFTYLGGPLSHKNEHPFACYSANLYSI